MFCVSDAWVKIGSHNDVRLLRTSANAWYILEAYLTFSVHPLSLMVLRMD